MTLPLLFSALYPAPGESRDPLVNRSIARGMDPGLRWDAGLVDSQLSEMPDNFFLLEIELFQIVVDRRVMSPGRPAGRIHRAERRLLAVCQRKEPLGLIGESIRPAGCRPSAHQHRGVAVVAQSDR